MAAADRPLAVVPDSRLGAGDVYVGDVDGASLAPEFMVCVDHYYLGALL